MCFMRRVLILFLLVGMALSADAGKVTLLIMATNPRREAQSCEIKSNLPAGIGTNDIINIGDLELKYDIHNDRYYVYKKVDLGAAGSGNEHAEYRIDLKDIWLIPEEEIEIMDAQAKALADMLVASPHEETAQGLLSFIKEKLAGVRTMQEENLVGKVDVMKHIRMYQACAEDLDRVKHDVGLMENLVLSTGKDPGQLIGKVKDIPKPDRDFVLPEDEYKTALIVIKVENTSPTETRVIPNNTTPALRRSLPAEIKPRDVLNQDELKALGMEVRTDMDKGISYLYVTKLEIPPLGSPGNPKVFNVKIRDKWNVNGPRIKSLQGRSELLLGQVQAARTTVPSVEALVRKITERLAAIETEEHPTELNSKYVAFFRDQSTRLDVVEEQLNRILSALKPMSSNTKLGFKAKPPSMKSTWMIIYIVLGFLALVSLLFFLRWYGKSKDEELEEMEQ